MSAQIITKGDNGVILVLASTKTEAASVLERLPKGWEWVFDGEGPEWSNNQKEFWFHQEERIFEI